jgi:hypothetical protein
MLRELSSSRGDKSSRYQYKARLSGLAEFSRLCKNSTDVYVRVGMAYNSVYSKQLSNI